MTNRLRSLAKPRPPSVEMTTESEMIDANNAVGGGAAALLSPRRTTIAASFSSGSDDDSDDDKEKIMRGVGLEETTLGGGGEQTALLDAAAAYMTRMENLYDTAADDNDDEHYNSVEFDDDNSKDIVVNLTIGSAEDYVEECSSLDCLHNNDGNCADNEPILVVNNVDPINSINGDVKINNNNNNNISTDEQAISSTSSSDPKLFNNNNMDLDDSLSFYIGDDDDGFIPSTSIHESDISETASETSMHEEYDSDVDDTSFTAFIGEEVIVTTNDAACRSDDDSESEQIPPPPCPSTHVDTNNDNDDNNDVDDSFFNDEIVGKKVHVGVGVFAGLIVDDDNEETEFMEFPTPSIRTPSLTNDDNDDDEEVSASVATYSQQTHDYVSTTLKKMLHKEESVLSHFMSSVNVMTSTPGRIANLCKEEIMNEDDDDEDVNLLVDVSGVDNSDNSSASCDREIFPSVKRKLAMVLDVSTRSMNVDDTPRNGTKSRRVDDSLSLDLGRSLLTESLLTEKEEDVEDYSLVSPHPIPAPNLQLSSHDYLEEELPSPIVMEEVGYGEEEETKHYAVVDNELLRALTVVDDEEDDDDDDFVPSSLKQLFRDADSELLDVLKSPLPEVTNGGEKNSGGTSFCEDYLKPYVSAPVNPHVTGSAIDNSLSNDTFDTALCSLGAIERTADDCVVEKERLIDINTTAAAFTRISVDIDAQADPRVVHDGIVATDENSEIQAKAKCNNVRSKKRGGNSSALASALNEYEINPQIETPYKTVISSCFHGEAPRDKAAVLQIANIVEIERLENIRITEVETARVETERLERERIAEAEHLEQERLAADMDTARVEQADRLERERLLAEEEAVRMEAELFERQRIAEERKRLLAEEEVVIAEAKLLERQRIEEEEAVRVESELLERQRIADMVEAARFSARLAAKAEEARLNAERVDSERIEQERLAVEAEAARLEVERRRIAAEVEKARLEVERLKHQEIDLAKSEDECLEQDRLAAELKTERLDTERVEEVTLAPEASVGDAANNVLMGEVELDSRPSSASSEKSNMNENMLNESMFMPNLSIDIADSPTRTFTDILPMPPMSEDESEEDPDDEDDEAFLPSPIIASNTPRTASLLKDIDECANEMIMDTEVKPVANQDSNTRGIPKPSSSVEAKISQKELTIAKRQPLSSAHLSTHKTGPTAASTKSEGKENCDDKVTTKMDHPSKMKHLIDSASTRSNKPSLVTRVRRQSESNLPVSTQRKPHLPAPPRPPTTKTALDVGRLERLARPRVRQSMIPLTESISSGNEQTTLSVSKRRVNVERINRLSQPKVRHSMIPLPNPDSVSDNRKKERRADGPPSFLSRPAATKYVVKSTSELEKEEMQRIKPFKAQKILGCSTEVKSRYKTATPRPAAPMPTVAASNRRIPASARPPSFPGRVYQSTPKRENVTTLGEQIQHYLNHGLRGGAIASPRVSAVPTATRVSTSTPKPPSLLRRQSLSYSVKPKAKSSEEIELEECKKQFKAITIGIEYGRPAIRHTTPTIQSQTPNQDRHRMLHTGVTRPPPPSTDELELTKQFKALPLPGSSTCTYNAGVKNWQRHDDYARMKRDRPKADTDTFKFKALPVPKSTYIAEEITLGSPVVTEPKSPGLAITRRAEARKLFDIQLHEKEVLQSEMKEKQEQHEKELEDAEIQRQRRSYADDGGFCFKATSISIEYI